MLPLIFLLNLLISGWALAADIEVSSDRNPVSLDESLTLTYSADTEPDGEPDFTPLEKDFEILNQGQNSQVTIINGHFQQTASWAVSLMPKRAGVLLIPPIHFGSDQSASLTLTVLPTANAGGKTDADIFLEVQAEPSQTYVQAQSIYTLRILSRITFNGGELSEPAAEHVLIQRLGEDRRYTTERQGQRYQVIERQYALFPQQSGPLTIPGLMLSTRMPGGRSGSSPFMGRQMQIKRLYSEPLTLMVKPVPESWKGHAWLPAEQVTLEESWSKAPETLTAGEPVTRTLTLKAQAATVGLLPDLMTNDQEHGDLGRYPDQPLLNEEKLASGLLSVRQEKAAYVPSRPGQYTVPAVDIHWWNTRSQREEVAHLAARTLTVKGTNSTPTPAGEPPKVLRNPPTPQPAPTVAAPGAAMATPGYWILLTAGFATAWIFTLLAWWLERRGRNRPPSPQSVAVETPSHTGTQTILAALRSACQENDAATAYKALLEWARLTGNDAPFNPLETWVAQTGTSLAYELERLNERLYSPTSRPWDGMALWAAFETCLKESKKPVSRKEPEPTLEPLYKHQRS